MLSTYAPHFQPLVGGRLSLEKQRVCTPSLLAHQEHPLTPLHVSLSYDVSHVGGGGGVSLVAARGGDGGWYDW